MAKDKQAYFEALKNLEPNAILHLSGRLLAVIKSLPGIYLFQREDIEELRNDSLLITLQKMGDGSFVFQDYDPLSYAVAVARRLLANLIRKRKLDAIPLESHQVPTGINPEKYYLQKEAELAIGELLATLGENCEQVIRLKYYENLRDQQVVDEKLTTYTTVDSLKNKRSQCLKKLSVLVKEKGYSLIELLGI